MILPTESRPAGDPALPGAAGVSGERGLPAVARTLSLQARISNWLAMGVMLLVGGGLLVWYYGHQLSHSARSRQELEGGLARQVSDEMSLPPLGPIELASAGGTAAPGAAASGDARVIAAAALDPNEAGMTAGSPAASAAAPVSALPVALPSIAPLALMPALAEAPGALRVLRDSAAGASRPPTVRDRRLSGAVFVALSEGSSTPTSAPTASGAPETTGQAPFMSIAQTPTAGGAWPAAQPAVGLSAPLATPTSARLLGPQSLLLPKGTSIDCTLETAIDSTLPGMTRCLTATDTFGADGRVVLLERGTELVGETQGQVQQGTARVFVLWSEARTPQGVIVPLESPGADELGRAGLPGTVQRHFWERFGAAILVSTIDGAVQAAVQASSQNSGAVIYNPGASQDMMTEVLRSTVAIPPTVRKANGDRIQVLVARDVDFGDVYELRPADEVR